MDYFENDDSMDDPFNRLNQEEPEDDIGIRKSTDYQEEEKDEVLDLESMSQYKKKYQQKKEEEFFSRITLKDEEGDQEVRKSQAMIDYQAKEKGKKYKDILMRASRFTKIATNSRKEPSVVARAS
mmetsp:Transcript_35580/g.34617  ORF Transcript_35580/g.34617 Transcript_35580/m.34617 type:complete len:125 (+) Transcript_35580:263-637(+)